MAQDQDQDGITAYHGSPHEFDKFDTSKIGTGEGAQAYGHGLYFAEREGIAKDYRNRLATETRAHNTFDGQKLTPSVIAKLQNHPDDTTSLFFRTSGRKPTTKDLRDFVDESIERHQNEMNVYKDRLEKHLSNPPFASTYGPDDYRQRIEHAKNLIDSYSKLKDRLDYVGPKKNAHMYEVHINAHPDHFLDWDKPMSEQHPNVQKFLSKVFNPPKEDQSIGAWLKPRLGEGMAEYWSDDMRKAGIPGIRYLDAGSRGPTDQPTHNYVVFDHNDVNIKRRYEQGGVVKPKKLPTYIPQKRDGGAIVKRALMVISKKA